MFSADVQYFLEAAAAGSISLAAERLGLSQPAVSKALARLERQLGVGLFVRTARGTVLTEAGRLFQERMASAAHHVEEAVELVRDVGHGQAGLLRVGMTPATSSFVLHALLPRLRQDRPACVLKLHEAFADELLDGLARHELNLAVAPLPPHLPPDLHAEVLFEERYWLALNQDHPLAGKKRLGPQDLAGCQVAASGVNEAARQLTERALREAGLRLPTVAVEANTLQALVHAVSTCELVTLIPDGVDPAQLPPNLLLKPLHAPTLRRQIGLFKGNAPISSIGERAMALLKGAAQKRRKGAAQARPMR